MLTIKKLVNIRLAKKQAELKRTKILARVLSKSDRKIDPSISYDEGREKLLNMSKSHLLDMFLSDEDIIYFNELDKGV
jgi:hypothetical protein